MEGALNLTTVKALARAKGMNQSDIARAAGVSRQRVSQWFKSNGSPREVNLRSDHLRDLAQELEVRIDDLLKPLPVIGEPDINRLETTNLLWDRLYPDLVEFAIDAGKLREKALARLVQVYGLFASAKMLGEKVWKKFPKYKKHIQPTLRKELEVIWSLRESRMNHLP